MLAGRTRDRVAGIAGLAFAVFMVAGWMAWYTPGLPALNGPATEVARWFVAHQTSCRIAAILGCISIFALFWFEVCMYGILREAEGGNGTVARVFFGAGLVTIVFDMYFCQFLINAAYRPRTTSPFVTQSLNDLFLTPGAAVFTSFMAMFVAIGVIVSNRGGLPRWLGQAAYLVAALQVLYVPTAFVYGGIFDISNGLLGVFVPFGAPVVWVAVSGVVLLRRAAVAPETRAATPPLGVAQLG
jgi:hypothetical protein